LDLVAQVSSAVKALTITPRRGMCGGSARDREAAAPMPLLSSARENSKRATWSVRWKSAD